MPAQQASPPQAGPGGGYRIFFRSRDILFARARALEKKSQWGQAAQLYRRILERSSTDLGARLRLCRVEERLGVAAADRIAFLEETVRLWPDSGGARYLLACVLAEGAEGESSPRVVRLLEEAIARSPDLNDAYLRLSKALQLTDPGAAFRYFAAYQERARQGALKRRDPEAGLGGRIRTVPLAWRLALGLAVVLALALFAWAVWRAGGIPHSGSWLAPLIDQRLT